MTDQKFKALLTAWDLKKNQAADTIFNGEDEEVFPTLFPENIMQTPDEIAQMVLASGQDFEKVVTFG